MALTYEQVKKIAGSLNSANGKKHIIEGFVEYFNKYAERYGITTYLRVCHFVAQCAHESAHFNTLEEYASGNAYEGRQDLGNTKPGDGKRYKGRGVIQLTGRYNYAEFSKNTGFDVLNHPLRMLEPELSVLAAMEYWKTRNLNKLADKDDVKGITKKINGGYNGLSDRKRYLAVAKSVFKNANLDFEDTPLSFGIREIQEKLLNLGYDVVGSADGIRGPKTDAGILTFKNEQMSVDNIIIDQDFIEALDQGKHRNNKDEEDKDNIKDDGLLTMLLKLFINAISALFGRR